MDIGRIGIWTHTLDGLPSAQAAEQVGGLEELGYGAVWVPEAVGREAFTNAALLLRGGTSIVLGIGAFPSLHVAAQMYVFLWMRRLWTSGEVLFGIFVVVIFLGSMITGWHYFIDGVAGVALALGCYVLFDRLERRRP